MTRHSPVFQLCLMSYPSCISTMSYPSCISTMSHPSCISTMSYRHSVCEKDTFMIFMTRHSPMSYPFCISTMSCRHSVCERLIHDSVSVKDTFMTNPVFPLCLVEIQDLSVEKEHLFMPTKREQLLIYTCVCAYWRHSIDKTYAYEKRTTSHLTSWKYTTCLWKKNTFSCLRKENNFSFTHDIVEMQDLSVEKEHLLMDLSVEKEHLLMSLMHERHIHDSTWMFVMDVSVCHMPHVSVSVCENVSERHHDIHS